MYSLNEQLTIALKKQNFKEATSLLEQGADINYKNMRGETPLFFFSSSLSLDVIDWLMENGANINETNNDGDTPLFHAVLRNDFKVVEKLLELGADVDIANKNLITPLMQAVLNEKDTGVFDAIMAANPNLDPITDSQTTPLLAAASRGKNHYVSALVEAGADIEAADYLGQGLLHAAVLSQNPAMVRLVAQLAPTLDPNYKARSGTSAMSITLGFPEMTSVFLEMGGDPNAKTANKINDGVTLLMGVVARFDTDLPLKEAHVPNNDVGEELLKNMIAKGVKVSERDDGGSNAASYAINAASITPLHHLVNAGLDPKRPVNPMSSLPYDLLASPSVDWQSPDTLNLIDEFHQMGFPLSRPVWDESIDGPWKKSHQEKLEKFAQPSPLQLMYLKGLYEAGEKMVSLGADINEKTLGGNSLSHLLVASGFDGMPEHIKKAIAIAKKAKNMDEDEKKETIKELQSEADDLFNEVCSNLNSHNIDWNSQNNKGDTPLHLAAKSGNMKWAKQLIMNENVLIDIKNNNGLTPASYALLSGNADMFYAISEMAKQQGKDIKKTALIESVQATSDDFRERQPWLRAVSSIDWSKEDLESKNESGQTSLYFAAATEQHDVVRELIKLGANPSTHDDSGNSALMHAVINQDGETIRLLRAAGVDRKHKNNNGQDVQDVAEYVNSMYVYGSLNEGDLSSVLKDIEVRPLTKIEKKQKEISKIQLENIIRSWKDEELLEVPEIPKKLIEEEEKRINAASQTSNQSSSIPPQTPSPRKVKK